MAICINFRCLTQNPDSASHCHSCGAPLLIRERYRAVRLLHPLHPSSPTQVFEVSDCLTQQRKILRMVHSDDPDLIERLMLIGVALRQIHDLAAQSVVGIPRVEADAFFPWRSLSDLPESYCLVVEFMVGEPLDQWLQHEGKISQALAIGWLIQLVRLADHLHQRGFLHRDIKPENLVVQENRQLTLIDFDTLCQLNPAYLAQLDVAQSSILGRSFALTPGTPGYTAPEQSDGKAIPASDFFAIGRTLCHLLTGIHPIDLPREPRTGRLLWQQQATPLDPLVADFIERLMSPNPIDRPHQADRMIQYLQQLPQRLNRRSLFRSKALRWFAVVGLLSFTALLLRSTSWFAARHYLLEGNRLWQNGDLVGAKHQYERALWFNQTDPGLYTNLGMSCAQPSNLQPLDASCAIKSFQQAIALSPTHASAHYNLGNVYEQLQQYRLAEYHYQQASQSSDAIRYDALNNWARLRILQQDFGTARVLIIKALEQVENPKTKAALYKNLGWVFFEQGSFNQADELLEKSKGLDPTRSDTYCLLAIIQSKENQSGWEDTVSCFMLPMSMVQEEVNRWKLELLNQLQATHQES